MSILTPNDVADFLGIDPSTPGLVEAIEQAESMTAAQMMLPTLEFGVREDEARLLIYDVQQIVPRYGPIISLTSFELDGEDVTGDIMVFSAWAFRWANPYSVDFERLRKFVRTSRVKYSYEAGWTNSGGVNPLPAAVRSYAMSMTGLTLNNMLASGVYDTKLGDMTVKIQRESIDKNLLRYEKLLRAYSRPF